MADMGTSHAASSARTQIGPYPVVREIGRGGMATVYLCAHPNIAGDRVAVKLYRASGRDPHVLRERQLAETEHLRRLGDVEGIVGVRDVGIDDGSPYIVMDYREGVDLSRWAELELPPPGRRRTLRATALLDRISAIIAEAHALDVIHHDLKPQNILVAGGRQPKPYIVDFGTARRVDDATMVGDPVIHGTVPYMAPEEFDRNASSDARLVDVWALGVITYELLAGRRPFEGASTDAVRHAILHRAPSPLSGRVPHLPEALDAVVLRSLSKRPEDRQASVAEFRSELLAAAGSERLRGVRRAAVAAGLAIFVAVSSWWWNRPVPTPLPFASIARVDGMPVTQGESVAFRTSTVTLALVLEGADLPSGSRLVVTGGTPASPITAEALVPRAGSPRDVVLTLPPALTGSVRMSITTPEGPSIPVAGGPWRVDRVAPTLAASVSFSDGRRMPVDRLAEDDVGGGTLRIETSDPEGAVTLRVKRDGRVVGEFPEATALSYPLHDLEGADVRLEAVDRAGNRTELRFKVPKREARCRVVLPESRRLVVAEDRPTVRIPVFLEAGTPVVSVSPPEALVETVARAGGVEVVVALPATRLELALAIVARSPSGPETKEAATLVRPMPPAGEAACELKLVDGQTPREGKATLGVGRHLLMFENRLRPRAFGFRARCRLTDLRSGNVLAEAALRPTSGINGANFDLLSADLDVGARALDAGGWGLDVVFEDDAGHRVQRRVSGPLLVPARRELPSSGPASRPGRRG